LTNKDRENIVRINNTRITAMQFTTEELAQHLQAELKGSGTIEINGIGPLGSATDKQVTFVAEEKYFKRLKLTKAGAVITPRKIEGISIPQLIVKDVNIALIETLKLFAPKIEAVKKGIDPSAKIGKNVKIAESAYIGYGVQIDDCVEVGENTVVSGGCKIGRGVNIGNNCHLYNNIVVHYNCLIGNNVVIQSNSVIGSVGFGYHMKGGLPKLIPHIGGVIIDDFVEIGANCCVDRAKFGNTRIGMGTKIDNLVQIAHNVTIGKCCLIAGMTGLGGSCKVGNGVVLAGQVGILDHIELANGTVIGGKSLVTSSTKPNQALFGFPAKERNKALRIYGIINQLPKYISQIKETKKKVDDILKLTEKDEPHPVKNLQQAERPTRFRVRRTAVWITSLVAAFLFGFFISYQIDSIVDSDESQVAQMVEKLQDGDDYFYVNDSPYLEDLRLEKNLFVVVNLSKAIEVIIANSEPTKDYYFLIPVKDLDGIRKTSLVDKLSIVTELRLGQDIFVLLSTKKCKGYRRLALTSS